MAKEYPAEIKAFILANGAMNRKELADSINAKFGTSYTRKQIQSRCTHLWLKAASDGRLRKGSKAWNKGLKGVNGVSWSRFKKGNIPATARPVGHERINRDGHIEVKVEGHRQMVFKHRWVWEQHHGPIPKGMVVSFRNGIRTDCRIDNLILLTRAELARLNQSYIHLSTPETHESCILLAKLKGVIHEKTKSRKC